MNNKTYICIDLKSFYASVECNERGLDPLTTNLVVADSSRTEKTICLAVSPSLKKYGIPGRARLFEVLEKVKRINDDRRKAIKYHKFKGKTANDTILSSDPYYELDFVIATPRMQFYLDYSTNIYSTYLKYIAPEDIHVYSIDEVFMDVTGYLNTYKISAHELAMKMIKDVLSNTGITATAGIGSNMYLAKVAMDIVAKKMPADKDGVRIAELNEQSYREQLWSHRPLTDFWRVGHGIASRLESLGLYTMGDIAKCSVGSINERYNEDLLYKTFGINAELLIDHAWGYEPCEMSHVKAYKPKSHSQSVGQVLSCPTKSEVARIIISEMVETLSLDLVMKKLLCKGISIYVGYDKENVEFNLGGFEIDTDYLGREVPKSAHGGIEFNIYTSSTRLLMEGALKIFDLKVDKALTIRRLNVAAFDVIEEKNNQKPKYEQLDLFTDYDAKKETDEKIEKALAKEKKSQEAILKIKEKYGKSAIMKGMNLEEGATQRDRNNQIGGHKK